MVASFKKNKHWYDNDYSSDGYWLLPSASDIVFFARNAEASAIGGVGSLRRQQQPGSRGGQHQEAAPSVSINSIV